MHLVVFDIDGTLVDSNDFDSRLYVQAVRSVLGVEIDSDWSAYQNVTDSGILDEILATSETATDDAQTRSSIKQTFIRLVSDYLAQRGNVAPEIPGAKAFVEALLRHPKVCVAIATGGWKETAIMKLNGIGLNGSALCLASASDAVRRVEIMQLAALRALENTVAAQRTYFGDGPWDEQASRELGYNFVAIGERLQSTIQFSNFRRADAILSALGLED